MNIAILLYACALGIRTGALAKAGLIGRRKAKGLRALAESRGWLDPKVPLPDEAVFATVLAGAGNGSRTPSCVEPYRSGVEGWAEQSVQCTTIYQALGIDPQMTLTMPDAGA